MSTQPNQTQAIMNLQRYLRQLSYSLPSIPPVPVDGVMEDATRRALIAYQTHRGLPPTGMADPTTWNTLYEDYRTNVAARSAPEPLYLFPATPSSYMVGTGDKGIAVQVIQLLLREALLSYGQSIDLIPDGIFDPRTEAAARAFQTVQRLPPTGRIDRRTWNRLARSYNIPSKRGREE